ncbi:Multidrug resistance protein MexA precursor [Lacunisphaera limnophila]|uniref:Multidrug resistance protein MexA n=1 Tax=Lacunisphaera limnophila TaxID=1838286 RepID=A0A1D8ATB4_9BACT|nr:efflux RND transporter periplasmic adaptor subunit [Lacunisphaera limnophila]AOS44145.1 Multidrug resistance protein MexA precursor [Lacunisphaera limnophila]
MRPSPFLLSLAAVLVTACTRQTQVSAPPEAGSLAVTTAVVVRENRPALIEMPATIRPVERAVISAKLTGTIATLPWGLGQAVPAGDVLVTLAVPETEARVRQAQASLAEAARATERERTLVAKGVNAPDSLRDAEDRLRFAQAGLAEAEAMLAHASIRAPFAGVVTEKTVLPGDLATPGLPLLTLESTARLRAEGAVPEQAAATLRIGDSLPVVVQDGAAPVAGRIEELSTAADALSRSVLVKVALPAGSARSGQFARLQVTAGASDSLFIPATALTRFGQMERVFVVTEGRAVLRLVKSGRTIGDRLEILSGLNAGEQIVLTPPAALRDGQRVTPQS